MSELGDTAALDAELAELEPIESLDHHIRDLTLTLQSSLPPEQFSLVWQLREAVEQLALAEEILHERRLVESLIRHLPHCAAAIRATSQHIRGTDFVAEEAV